jgi:hypothetical protein
MQIPIERRFAQSLLLLPLLVAMMMVSAFAQDAQQQPSQSPAANGTQPAATASVPASPLPERLPKVIAIAGNLELDDVVTIDLEHLEPWAQQNDASKLVPHINGRVIKGNYPEELHVSRGRLIFHLEVTPESREVWNDLLGAPDHLRRPVTFTVGLENGVSFDSLYLKNNPVILTVISPFYGIVALLVIAVTLILLVWLARTTNIIREPGLPPGPGKRRPYNLGRAQMAFWFFLIYASYMAIWLITSALDTITPSLLALMGISTGTALGEALIDTGKETAKTNQVQELTAERAALDQGISQTEAELNAIGPAPAGAGDQTNRDALSRQLVDSRTRLGQIDQQMRSLATQPSANISSGFLRDILADSSGYSFHRFQIFAWTIVLGIIFMSTVYNNLSMPEFRSTLLGLMGLSAGTYIGFKFPEQK